MGNEYLHHRRRYRSSIMPMLCLRPSATTDDELLSNWDDAVASSPDLDKYCNEPASPRVGCMGQIKHNNKVVGFPIHHTYNNHTNRKKKKYLKLNRIFSCKYLISSTCSRRQMIMGGSGTKFYDGEACVSIGVVELDPPLPVVKPVPHVGKDSREAVSLWERRCGGETLKALQLQHLSCVHEPTSL